MKQLTERSRYESSYCLPCNCIADDWSSLIGASLFMAGALVLAPSSQAADAPTSQEAFTQCVAMRESHGNPKAIGDQSSARGKYQFLRAWNHGLPFMVRDRLMHFGMKFTEADALRKHLQHTPINKWSEQLQDVAFLAVLNARGPWSGWRHWYIAGSKCNGLVKR